MANYLTNDEKQVDLHNKLYDRLVRYLSEYGFMPESDPDKDCKDQLQYNNPLWLRSNIGKITLLVDTHLPPADSRSLISGVQEGASRYKNWMLLEDDLGKLEKMLREGNTDYTASEISKLMICIDPFLIHGR